jgi:hypothetical protein
MTDKKMVGKYFTNENGFIYIEGINNEYIYDYFDVDFDENGNLTVTERGGYITPQELKHYTEI